MPRSRIPDDEILAAVDKLDDPADESQPGAHPTDIADELEASRSNIFERCRNLAEKWRLETVIAIPKRGERPRQNYRLADDSDEI
ncbi:hypothetical protein [Haladaptatus cibarius]|uniref:hypothetical protein n=1 Tax=Haladaptatus cibarius TaxID=453847 RepID=UPI000679CA81|nr:hypothetical protein [Haladaptatus cibarius]